MQSLLQVSEDEIASNFRHAIRMQFLVGSLPLFLSFMKWREENPRWIHLGMCFHIFGRRYPTLPLSSLFWDVFFPGSSVVCHEATGGNRMPRLLTMLLQQQGLALMHCTLRDHRCRAGVGRCQRVDDVCRSIYILKNDIDKPFGNGGCGAKPTR